MNQSVQQGSGHTQAGTIATARAVSKQDPEPAFWLAELDLQNGVQKVRANQDRGVKNDKPIRSRIRKN